MILPFLKKHCKVLATIAGESSAHAGPAHFSCCSAHHSSNAMAEKQEKGNCSSFAMQKHPSSNTMLAAAENHPLPPEERMLPQLALLY